MIDRCSSNRDGRRNTSHNHIRLVELLKQYTTLIVRQWCQFSFQLLVRTKKMVSTHTHTQKWWWRIIYSSIIIHIHTSHFTRSFGHWCIILWCDDGDESSQLVQRQLPTVQWSENWFVYLIDYNVRWRWRLIYMWRWNNPAKYFSRCVSKFRILWWLVHHKYWQTNHSVISVVVKCTFEPHYQVGEIGWSEESQSTIRVWEWKVR